jgi:hypothetical protein
VRDHVYKLILLLGGGGGRLEANYTLIQSFFLGRGTEETDIKILGYQHN